MIWKMAVVLMFVVLKLAFCFYVLFHLQNSDLVSKALGFISPRPILHSPFKTLRKHVFYREELAVQCLSLQEINDVMMPHL